MPILTPSELPIELIENIIDEVFYSQLSTSKKTIQMVDPQTLSSLARVSHVFRQRINSHRFSIVSFQRSNFSPAPLHYIHAFLDLLQSDVWVAPSMGVAHHVRKLVLILKKGIDMQGEIGPHPAMEDGSLARITNMVFRESEGYPYSKNDYTLALWGCVEWGEEVINPEFISSIESLLDSHVATLELTYLHAIPPTLLKGRHVKHVSLHGVSFQWTLNPEHVLEYTALGPWNQLESLDIQSAPGFFNLVAPGDIPMLKALSFTLSSHPMDDSISSHWRHWSMLEDLTLNLDSDNRNFSHFHVDYTHLSRLKRLTINLLLVRYNSDRSMSSIESSTYHILNLLGPDLPPLARLEISIDGAFIILFRDDDIRRTNDIPTEIDCASIDAVLAQFPPSVISTIVVRFRITLSRDVEAALALEMFRQDGLDVLHEAFPMLNAGPRQREYDSEVSTRTVVSQSWERWEGQEQAEVLLYTGMFSVAYTPAAP